MLKIEVTEELARIELCGTSSDLAAQLAEAVGHVTHKIIERAKTDDRRELAGVLATGMALAVRRAYTKTKEAQHEAENG